ncbi:MAG: hypothetical protein ABMA64_18600 [Myxococcota bacterium]
MVQSNHAARTAVAGGGRMAHGSRLTAHGSRLTAHGSRLTAALTVALLGAVPREAAATLTIATCASSADAPSEYWNNSCGSACTYNSATDMLTCDMKSVDLDDRYATAFVVATYGASTHEYSAFGIVDNTRFCCTIDEDSTDKVRDIELKGTEVCDTLRFSWDDGSGGVPEENLEPASNWSITGTILSYDGPAEGLAAGAPPGATGCWGDISYGSNYQGSDFVEVQFGGLGPDHMYGLADKDYLDGGPGDDTIEGGTGNDVVVGGCGADEIHGQYGNDAICDTNGNLIDPGCACNADGDDLMYGDGDKDSLWYADTPTCSGGTLNSASACGDGSQDVFGDGNVWSTALGCEVPTNIAVDCSFP